jgi:prepilin-type N-terminal cleavage/methylation domain-containing protein
MNPTPLPGKKRRGAFTFIELLVVLAIIVVLGMVRWPALASSNLRVLEASCRNNFRQLSQGAAVYAAQYDDNLPPVWIDPRSTTGPHGINGFAAEHYGRYLYVPAPGDPPAPFKIKQTNSPYLQNLGYLYPMNLVGDGSMYYCPVYNIKPQNDQVFSKEAYCPLITTASDGFVRSSDVWNPWANVGGPNINMRMYPKQSDFKSAHILQMENLVNLQPNANDPLDPATVAHDRSGTLTILMSDYSVRTAKITPKVWTFAHAGPGNNLSNAGFPVGLTNVLMELEKQLTP